MRSTTYLFSAGAFSDVIYTSLIAPLLAEMPLITLTLKCESHVSEYDDPTPTTETEPQVSISSTILTASDDLSQPQSL